MTKCNECGKLCTPSEMTDDKRMCKDCYIKWLEGQYKELKKDNEGYEKDNTRLVNQFNQTGVKLLRAKKILGTLVSICKSCVPSETLKLNEQFIIDAETFLKD